MSDRSNQTVCLSQGGYTDSDKRLQLSNLSHVTIRNVPRQWVVLKGQLRLSSSVNDVTFYGVKLDDSPNQSGTETSVYVAGGDRIRFERVSVTNQGTNGSCFHTSNADPSQDVTITRSKVFECGFDGEHDHNIYLGKGIRWTVSENWIYEGASRNIATHSASRDALIERNVIAQGCRNHGIPSGAGCSASVLFSENATNAVVRDNTIVYVRNGRWNVDEWNLAGTGNVFADNCLWSDYSDRGRIGISWDEGSIVTDPLLDPSYTSPLLQQRDYTVHSFECAAKQPTGPVGFPG